MNTPTYEVRTSRNEGFVDRHEQAVLRTSSIFVCGVGGMGGAAVASLARAGVGRLGIADFDTFEASNLNRQLFASTRTLGRSKTEAVREELLTIDPELRVERYGADWTDRLAEILTAHDIVVNGMDDPRAALALYRAARRHRVTVVDAFVSPHPSVAVVRPDDPRPEEWLRFPTVGVDLEAVTDEMLGRALLRELGYVASVSGGIGRLAPELVAEVLRGTRPRPSFAPVVLIAGNLMALEAIGVLVGREGGADHRGYFLDPWTGSIERPGPEREVAARQERAIEELARLVDDEPGRLADDEPDRPAVDRATRPPGTIHRLVERDFDAFFRVPFGQYGPEEAYVSPFRGDLARILDGTRNPVFEDPELITYFTAHRAGRAVGRITAHVHAASNERHGLRRGSFGFFDCAPDRAAARMLLDAAAEWLAARGCDEIAGNFNLTAMQEMGVVVVGHERAPFTAQHHNPAWIPDLLLENGFEPFFPMTTWRVRLPEVDPERFHGPKQRALSADPRLTVEAIRRRGFRASMEAAWHLLNDSFSANPLFVPLTREEFFAQVDQMLLVFDPRIAFLARLGGQPVGVLACLPDANPLLAATGSRMKASTPIHYLRHRLRRTRASLVFGGVAPQMQDRGLAGLLLHRALESLRAAGYQELGITWISDTNGPSLRQMEKMGAEPWHRLNLFRRSLDARSGS